MIHNDDIDNKLMIYSIENNQTKETILFGVPREVRRVDFGNKSLLASYDTQSKSE